MSPQKQGSVQMRQILKISSNNYTHQDSEQRLWHETEPSERPFVGSTTSHYIVGHS